MLLVIDVKATVNHSLIGDVLSYSGIPCTVARQSYTTAAYLYDSSVFISIVLDQPHRCPCPEAAANAGVTLSLNDFIKSAIVKWTTVDAPIGSFAAAAIDELVVRAQLLLPLATATNSCVRWQIWFSGSKLKLQEALNIASACCRWPATGCCGRTRGCHAGPSTFSDEVCTTPVPSRPSNPSATAATVTLFRSCALPHPLAAVPPARPRAAHTALSPTRPTITHGMSLDAWQEGCGVQHNDKGRLPACRL